MKIFIDFLVGFCHIEQALRRMKPLNRLSIILIWLLTLYPIMSFSQEGNETKHQISILWGITNYNTYEPILSSVRQSSTPSTSGLAYAVERENNYEFGVKLLLLNESDLTSRLSNPGSRAPNNGEIFGGSFETYFRKLIKKTSVDIYLGFHLNGFYYDKSLDVIPFDDARAADLFFDLGPSVSIVKNFGKHRLGADLELPLIGYIAAKTRNSETFPFDLIDRDKTVGTAIRYGDLALINNYFNINFNAEYAYRLTQKILIGLQYGFQYYDYKKELPFNVQAVSYRFLLQAQYEF